MVFVASAMVKVRITMLRIANKITVEVVIPPAWPAGVYTARNMYGPILACTTSSAKQVDSKYVCHSTHAQNTVKAHKLLYLLFVVQRHVIGSLPSVDAARYAEAEQHVVLTH
jgi:hypothetical protein